MKTSKCTPTRLDEDLLTVYRLMPSQDEERLLSHIAWMEAELERVKSLQNETEHRLEQVSAELDQQRGAKTLKVL